MLLRASEARRLCLYERYCPLESKTRLASTVPYWVGSVLLKRPAIFSSLFICLFVCCSFTADFSVTKGYDWVKWIWVIHVYFDQHFKWKVTYMLFGQNVKKKISFILICESRNYLVKKVIYQLFSILLKFHLIQRIRKSVAIRTFISPIQRGQELL